MDVSLWEALLCTPLSHNLYLYITALHNTFEPLICQANQQKNYSSSSSSSATAATVEDIVDATTITTVIQIPTTIVKNVNKNPSGVIIRSPISPSLIHSEPHF